MGIKVVKPLISVIIPVFNSEICLDRCIQSVLDQEYPFFELILVDDGSTDRSPELIHKWEKKDNRICAFRQENRGQSAARNLGLDHAEGEYISFVDSDDYIAPDYLSYLLSLFGEGCQLTACNHFIVTGRKCRANSNSKNRTLSGKEAFEEVLFHGCIDVSPWGKLYRKTVFSALRFPEGRIFEDTWLFGDILLSTEKIAYGEKCCYFYDIQRQSTVRNQYSPKNLQYIEAARKLADDAVHCDPALKTGGIRRINHARLSVLRYMEHSGERDTRKLLRQEILTDAPLFINHPRTPKRDKIAVKLLKMGLKPFYTGWKIYSLFR